MIAPSTVMCTYSKVSMKPVVDLENIVKGAKYFQRGHCNTMVKKFVYNLKINGSIPIESNFFSKIWGGGGGGGGGGANRHTISPPLYEAIEKFVLYKNEVENQLNKKIKVLKSDRGGEYESTFVDVCTKHEIIHETTTPY